MNGYELSRFWFDWCFENPEKIKPNHTALYFFCVEHCNRLGWKHKFGLPTTMAKEAIGIRSYNTYIQTMNDLVDWGFIEMIERSKNQYSSNIIALSNFDKALDKALIKHTTKQSESTRQSIDSIDKPLTKEPLTINQEQRKTPTLQEVKDCISSTLFQKGMSKNDFPVEQLAEKFWNNYETKGWQINGQQMVKWKPKVSDWINDHLKDPTRLLGKNQGQVSAQDAEEMDIAILKHMRNVQSENDNTGSAENNRLRRIS